VSEREKITQQLKFMSGRARKETFVCERERGEKMKKKSAKKYFRIFIAILFGIFFCVC
jgi:hypothetical protein